jgi:hypothetical protein
MSNDDETNAVLREIRDLLAQREEQYQRYLADIKQVYVDQLKMAEAQRARAIRTLSILGAVFGGLVAIAILMLR